MKVNILTPVRKGGPYLWGKNLVKDLNKKGIKARHIYKIKDLLLAMFHQNANIVHTTVPIMFKLWKKPIVLTLKGDYTIEDNIWRKFYPSIIKKADIITTPSKYLKKKLNLKKAIVIPNAVDLDKFDREAKHQNKKIINIVTVTNLSFEDKSKGILDIIKILNSLKKNGIQINYSIVADGRYLQETKKEVDKIKRINVSFLGYKKNVKEVLQKSDLFLYYSAHDNFPNVLIESMACGLPVITNEIGAVSEIIENKKNGFIAKDESEYKKILEELIKNWKLRKKIGVNARKRIKKKFDCKKIVNEYIKIYSQLLKWKKIKRIKKN